MQMRRFDPTTTLVLSELGAIVKSDEETGSLAVEMVVDDDPEVDIEEGDAILMVNGERVRSIAALREAYEGVAEGEEVKLALKRDERRFLAAFSRQPGDGFTSVSSSGGGTRVLRMGSGGGDIEVLAELGVVTEESGVVKVADELPIGDGSALAPDDEITALDGREIAS